MYDDQICYSLAIPVRTALDGRGDTYINIEARSNVSWVGLGQGTDIKNSSMFIVYRSQDGKGVTLSTRRGVDAAGAPQYKNNTGVTISTGTTLVDAGLLASIKC